MNTGDIEQALDDDLDQIEATLGRLMQDGKNKPFQHTCEAPSQHCDCWIKIDGEDRVKSVWFSVRPNRAERRRAAAERKEPLRNDGTPKRFDKTFGRRKRATTDVASGEGPVGEGIQRSTGTDATEHHTDQSR